MNVLRALHCVGVVTNGSVRDIPAARSAGFHYFAGSVAVSHGYVHIVDFGQPVEIGGLTIASGDLLHGDLHGVQSVPLGDRRADPRRGGGHQRPRAGTDRAVPLAGVHAREAARVACAPAAS